MPILMTNINSYHTSHNPYIDMHICGLHNNDRVQEVPGEGGFVRELGQCQPGQGCCWHQGVKATRLQL